MRGIVIGRGVVLALAALLASSLVAPSPADAQQRSRPQRYQSSRPTVSPYLNLLRLNTSPLPNYQSLVRPQQQQRLINEQQRLFNRQQQQRLVQQNQTILGLQAGLIQVQVEAATGSPSGFQVPGSRSSFQSSGAYFQTR